MNDYSVLMSVYHKEKGEYLRTAILSMLNQSLKPFDFVLVCDGPLNDDLDSVIAEFENNSIFQIIRLEKNSGLGDALRIGLEKTKCDYVLRMDSDDISYPNRAELQIAKLNEGFDIVGGSVSEFQNDDPNDYIGSRTVPLENEAIYKFAKKRSPFNHPSVSFRKSKIIEAGGYQRLLYMEDYFLWVRCIEHKARCANLPDNLVNMRSGYSMRSRRGGVSYKESMVTLFNYMRSKKMISFFRCKWNIFIYDCYAGISPSIKNFLITYLLRSKKK